MVKPVSSWVGRLVVVIVLAGVITACGEEGHGPEPDSEAHATRESPPAVGEGNGGEGSGGTSDDEKLGPAAEQVKIQVSVSIAALREGAFDAAYLFETEEFQRTVSLQDYVRVHTTCMGGLEAWEVQDVLMVGSDAADVTHVYSLDFASTDRFVRQDGRWRWPVNRSELGHYTQGGADFVIQQRRSAGICTPAQGKGFAWSCPDDRPVKGNVSFDTKEKIYHLPDSWLYPVTSPDECFPDEHAAERAGYRASRG